MSNAILTRRIRNLYQIASQENMMSTQQSVVPALQTGHVGLNVSSVNQSKEFYQQVFGFQVIRESQDEEHQFALLGVDGNVVVTLWQQSSGKFAKDVPGLHHLAFRVDTMDEVKVIEGKLRALKARFLYDGIVPHSEGAQSGGIFFEDPDGIRLEIFTPQGASNLQAPSHGPSCGFF
jgi:lactoylglutathione lyase